MDVILRGKDMDKLRLIFLKLVLFLISLSSKRNFKQVSCRMHCGFKTSLFSVVCC